MQRRSEGQVAFYTFDSLAHSSVVHAVSTRHGGTSPAPFHTLNLSTNVGDARANVASNQRRLHTAVGLDETKTVTASQAQADAVAIVGAEHSGTRIPNVDALLTNARGVPLLLRYADCVPILLFDPVRSAVGIVHAGWRGTVSKIVTHAAVIMFNTFGTRPGDLVACIGPSIGPCCYSVRQDVVEQVHSAFGDTNGLLTTRDDLTYFDLWQANAGQLHSLGVEHVETAGICTAHHTEDFFSARAEKSTGRFGAIIALA